MGYLDRRWDGVQGCKHVKYQMPFLAGLDEQACKCHYFPNNDECGATTAARATTSAAPATTAAPARTPPATTAAPASTTPSMVPSTSTTKTISITINDPCASEATACANDATCRRISSKLEGKLDNEECSANAKCAQMAKCLYNPLKFLRVSSGSLLYMKYLQYVFWIYVYTAYC